MNLDDVKSDWTQQHSDLAAEQLGLAAQVVAKTSKLERAIWRRDLVEVVAAAFVIGVFAAFIWLIPLPAVAVAGVVIIILGVIEAVCVMFWTRHRDDRPSAELPLLEFCQLETRRMDRQIKLLRNVSWWYTGPTICGCCVMVFGMFNFGDLKEMPFWAVCVFQAFAYVIFFAVAVYVHQLNARAVVAELLPIRDELANLVETLDNGDAESNN